MPSNNHLDAWYLIAVFFFVGSSTACGDSNLIIADFEGSTYSGWTVSGTAFGSEPATGTLPNQMHVSGYFGSRLVNTFADGDSSIGEAISQTFAIEAPYIAFLIGGGSDAKLIGIELILERTGEAIRVETGSESERLTWKFWDVRDLKAEKARLRIFDRSTGGWGHICIDQIIQTEEPPKAFDLDRELALYRQSTSYMNESLRSQFHFSPEINWMNDPNGLVYHEGEYHLFHQYNPAGNDWGHMSWGHAVSNDLIHWKHLPLAIPESNGKMAFSGCCVIDHRNTSQLGDGISPPMIAIYTAHGGGKQVQNLAFSHDRGRTWKAYDSNPVLDLNNSDFRDPKVFWHEPSDRWFMLVSLAVEKVIVFYSSENLKDWVEVSRFGPAGIVNKPNWECPDLFELPVENEPGTTRWVLETDIGNGSVAGGSGGEYFVGTFDGIHFKTQQRSQWVDYGRDFYAPITWSNLPKEDKRCIWIGWLNNWETSMIPTNPWRGCMSIPRSLSLRKISFNENEPPNYVLIQKPIQELKRLRISTQTPDAANIRWPPKTVFKTNKPKESLIEIEADMVVGSARSVGFRIRSDENEYIEIGYDRFYAGVYVDRSHSGNVQFHPNFPGRHHAPARLIDGRIRLHAFIDRSTIEVFVNDGEAVISDRYFPSSQSKSVEAFAGDETAAIENLTIHQLNSIWQTTTLEIDE